MDLQIFSVDARHRFVQNPTNLLQTNLRKFAPDQVCGNTAFDGCMNQAKILLESTIWQKGDG